MVWSELVGEFAEPPSDISICGDGNVFGHLIDGQLFEADHDDRSPYGYGTVRRCVQELLGSLGLVARVPKVWRLLAVDHDEVLANPGFALGVTLRVERDDTGRSYDDVVDVASVVSDFDGVEASPLRTKPRQFAANLSFTLGAHSPVSFLRLCAECTSYEIAYWRLSVDPVSFSLGRLPRTVRCKIVG